MEGRSQSRTLSPMPRRQLVDIEFQDLTYTVPQGRKGSKLILRSVSGKFRSRQLTAILGPSGAGKSTLLNILAGYKCNGATGSILVNGEPRNLKEFRRISRYIMQEDLIQPMLTVEEVMMVAARLKLGKDISHCDKLKSSLEILDMLRLTGARNTYTNKLSGGERKRLSIALELINNPPVLFLDEPTTGLDDLSSSQCIALLKQIAEGDRTVICSIHTPSARLFSIFNMVYILSQGQCTYQGYGPDVVPYLSGLGLGCPTHYNPADFIIEVCCAEYGDCHERLVSTIDNGKNIACKDKMVSVFDHQPDKDPAPRMEYFECQPTKQSTVSALDQFRILLMRMWLQMWRNKSYLVLKAGLHLFVGLIIGNLYIGMGRDGSKTIFNFGFYFTCIIFFMYVPMMPVLLSFPTEVQYLKREHFNKWYGLGSFFWAWTVSSLPVQTVLGAIYLSLVYIFSYQPFEFTRIIPFYFICMLTSVVSESIALVISSTLNIVNGMFVGPVITVPFMLLAAYGFGEGYSSIPILIKIAMHFNYLRYSMEGIVAVMMRGRPKLTCPDEEMFCMFLDLDKFIEVMAMDNAVVWIDIVALITFLVLFRSVSYYLLRQRLTPNKTFIALNYVGQFIKSHFAR